MLSAGKDESDICKSRPSFFIVAFLLTILNGPFFFIRLSEYVVRRRSDNDKLLVIILTIFDCIMLVTLWTLCWIKMRMLNSENVSNSEKAFAKRLNLMLPVIISFFYGFQLLIEVSAGQCESDEYFQTFMCNQNDDSSGLPTDTTSVLVFVPIYFSVHLLHEKIYTVLCSWILALGAIFGAGVLKNLIVYLPAFIVYFVVCFSVFFDILVYQRPVFRSIDHLSSLEDRGSSEQQTTELRHMIANVAHDLKTVRYFLSKYRKLNYAICNSLIILIQPLTSFLSGIELLGQIVTDWRSRESSMNMIAKNNSAANSNLIRVVGSISLSPLQIPQSGEEQELHHLAEYNRQYIKDNLNAISDCLQSIRNTSTFMCMTINRCLDSTKAGDGMKLIPRPETFHLQQAIDLPVHIMKDFKSHLKLTLLPLPTEICSHIITDKQWLQENILCLISNAVKYSSKGSIEVSFSMTRGSSVHPNNSPSNSNCSNVAADSVYANQPYGREQQQQHLPSPRSPSHSLTAAAVTSNMIATRSSSPTAITTAVPPPPALTTTNSSTGGSSSPSFTSSSPLNLFRKKIAPIDLRPQQQLTMKDGSSAAASSSLSPRNQSPRRSNNNTTLDATSVTRVIGQKRSTNHNNSNNCTSTTSIAMMMMPSPRRNSNSSRSNGSPHFSGRSDGNGTSTIIGANMEESSVTIHNNNHWRRSTSTVMPYLPSSSLQTAASASSISLSNLESSNIFSVITSNKTAATTTEHRRKSSSTSAAFLSDSADSIYNKTTALLGFSGSDCFNSANSSGKDSKSGKGSSAVVYLRIEVQDTGIGMSEEAMQNLFSPFKQAQRLAGGTGLGLYSLAKRIEALQGQYGVNKRKDGLQGCMFWFTIPYRPDIEYAMQLLLDSEIESQQQPQSPEYLSYQQQQMSPHQKIVASSTPRSIRHNDTSFKQQQQQQCGLVRVFEDNLTTSSVSCSCCPDQIPSLLSERDIESGGQATGHIELLTPCNSNNDSMDGGSCAMKLSVAQSSRYTTVANASSSCFNNYIDVKSTDDDSRYDQSSNVLHPLLADTSSFAANAAVNPSLHQTHSPYRRKPPPQQQQQANVRPLCILIVDDSPPILKITGMLLRKQGHEVDEAINGAEALDMIWARCEGIESNDDKDEDIMIADDNNKLSVVGEGKGGVSAVGLSTQSAESVVDSSNVVGASIDIVAAASCIMNTESSFDTCCINISNNNNSNKSCRRRHRNVVAMYDLILMDLQMPVMDGLESTRRLREKEEKGKIGAWHESSNKDYDCSCRNSKKNNNNNNASVIAGVSSSIKDIIEEDDDAVKLIAKSGDNYNSSSSSSSKRHFVIGLSANNDPDTKNEAMRAGCDAFISKPFAVESLYKVLRLHQRI